MTFHYLILFFLFSCVSFSKFFSPNAVPASKAHMECCYSFFARHFFLFIDHLFKCFHRYLPLFSLFCFVDLLAFFCMLISLGTDEFLLHACWFVWASIFACLSCLMLFGVFVGCHLCMVKTMVRLVRCCPRGSIIFNIYAFKVILFSHDKKKLESAMKYYFCALVILFVNFGCWFVCYSSA